MTRLYIAPLLPLFFCSCSNLNRKLFGLLIVSIDGTGRTRTGDLALQIGVSFLTLWTIPSPWAYRL